MYLVFTGSSFSARPLAVVIPLKSKQMTDYCFRRIKAVRQEAFFFQQMANV